MFNQLPALRRNLQEIYAASQQPGPIQNHLVAWGNSIYCKQTSWLGKTIKWINAVLDFFKSDYSSNRIQDAVVATHALFVQIVAETAPHLNACEIALNEWSNGQAEAKERFAVHFSTIQPALEGIRPFMKLCHKNTLLDPLFIPNFPAFQHTKTAFHNQALYERMGQIKAIYQLTALSLGRLPLHLIKKNANGGPFEKQELEEFKAWFRKIKWHHQPFPLRHLQKGINHLCSFFEKNKSKGENFSKGFVEWNLFLMDHPLFNSPDPKHLLWRSQFKQGSKIPDYHLDKLITLAEPLNNKLNGFYDKTIAFRIDAPNPYAILFGHNCSVLNVRKIGRENPSNGLFGFRASTYHYVEPKGRYAIVELLYPMQDPIPLINQMDWLRKQVWTPSNLALKYLLFNRRGQLVSVKNHVRDTFDLMAIEKLAYDFSKGDLMLYRTMITESNLIRHPQAQYFHECIMEGLLGNPYVKKVADPIRDEIWSGKVMEQGIILHREASDLGKLVRPDPEKWNRALEFHKSLARAGRIWKEIFTSK